MEYEEYHELYLQNVMKIVNIQMDQKNYKQYINIYMDIYTKVQILYDIHAYI